MKVLGANVSSLNVGGKSMVNWGVLFSKFLGMLEYFDQKNWGTLLVLKGISTSHFRHFLCILHLVMTWCQKGHYLDISTPIHRILGKLEFWGQKPLWISLELKENERFLSEFQEMKWCLNVWKTWILTPKKVGDFHRIERILRNWMKTISWVWGNECKQIADFSGNDVNKQLTFRKWM